MEEKIYIVYKTEIDRTKIREEELEPMITLITKDKEKAYNKLKELKEESIDYFGEEEVYDYSDHFIYDVYRKTAIAGVLEQYID